MPHYFSVHKISEYSLCPGIPEFVSAGKKRLNWCEILSNMASFISD